MGNVGQTLKTNFSQYFGKNFKTHLFRHSDFFRMQFFAYQIMLTMFSETCVQPGWSRETPNWILCIFVIIVNKKSSHYNFEKYTDKNLSVCVININEFYFKYREILKWAWKKVSPIFTSFFIKIFEKGGLNQNPHFFSTTSFRQHFYCLNDLEQPK